MSNLFMKFSVLFCIGYFFCVNSSEGRTSVFQYRQDYFFREQYGEIRSVIKVRNVEVDESRSYVSGDDNTVTHALTIKSLVLFQNSTEENMEERLFRGNYLFHRDDRGSIAPFVYLQESALHDHARATGSVTELISKAEFDLVKGFLTLANNTLSHDVDVVNAEPKNDKSQRQTRRVRDPEMYDLAHFGKIMHECHPHTRMWTYIDPVSQIYNHQIVQHVEYPDDCTRIRETISRTLPGRVNMYSGDFQKGSYKATRFVEGNNVYRAHSTQEMRFENFDPYKTGSLSPQGSYVSVKTYCYIERSSTKVTKNGFPLRDTKFYEVRFDAFVDNVVEEISELYSDEARRGEVTTKFFTHSEIDDLLMNIFQEEFESPAEQAFNLALSLEYLLNTKENYLGTQVESFFCDVVRGHKPASDVVFKGLGKVIRALGAVGAVDTLVNCVLLDENVDPKVRAFTMLHLSPNLRNADLFLRNEHVFLSTAMERNYFAFLAMFIAAHKDNAEDVQTEQFQKAKALLVEEFVHCDLTNYKGLLDAFELAKIEDVVPYLTAFLYEFETNAVVLANGLKLLEVYHYMESVQHHFEHFLSHPVQAIRLQSFTVLLKTPERNLDTLVSRVSQENDQTRTVMMFLLRKNGLYTSERFQPSCERCKVSSVRRTVRGRSIFHPPTEYDIDWTIGEDFDVCPPKVKEYMSSSIISVGHASTSCNAAGFKLSFSKVSIPVFYVLMDDSFKLYITIFGHEIVIFEIGIDIRFDTRDILTDENVYRRRTDVDDAIQNGRKASKVAVTPYCMDDAAWADRMMVDKLIGEEGSQLCSYAMLLNSKGIDFDPSTLNDFLRLNNGYKIEPSSEVGDINLGVTQQFGFHVKSVDKSEIMTVIGNKVIMKLPDVQRYLVCISKSGDSVTCYDPWASECPSTTTMQISSFENELWYLEEAREGTDWLENCPFMYSKDHPDDFFCSMDDEDAHFINNHIAFETGECKEGFTYTQIRPADTLTSWNENCAAAYGEYGNLVYNFDQCCVDQFEDYGTCSNWGRDDIDGDFETCLKSVCDDIVPSVVITWTINTFSEAEITEMKTTTCPGEVDVILSKIKSKGETIFNRLKRHSCRCVRDEADYDGLFSSAVFSECRDFLDLTWLPPYLVHNLFHYCTSSEITDGQRSSLYSLLASTMYFEVFDKGNLTRLVNDSTAEIEEVMAQESSESNTTKRKYDFVEQLKQVNLMKKILKKKIASGYLEGVLFALYDSYLDRDGGDKEMCDSLPRKIFSFLILASYKVDPSYIHYVVKNFQKCTQISNILDIRNRIFYTFTTMEKVEGLTSFPIGRPVIYTGDKSLLQMLANKMKDSWENVTIPSSLQLDLRKPITMSWSKSEFKDSNGNQIDLATTLFTFVKPYGIPGLLSIEFGFSVAIEISFDVSVTVHIYKFTLEGSCGPTIDLQFNVWATLNLWIFRAGIRIKITLVSASTMLHLGFDFGTSIPPEITLGVHLNLKVLQVESDCYYQWRDRIRWGCVSFWGCKICIPIGLDWGDEHSLDLTFMSFEGFSIPATVFETKFFENMALDPPVPISATVIVDENGENTVMLTGDGQGGITYFREILPLTFAILPFENDYFDIMDLDLDPDTGSLTIRPFPFISGVFSVYFRAYSTDEASESIARLTVKVKPVPNRPNLYVDKQSIFSEEDEFFEFYVSAKLQDLDGSEILRVKITDIPENSTIAVNNTIREFRNQEIILTPDGCLDMQQHYVVHLRPKRDAFYFNPYNQSEWRNGFVLKIVAESEEVENLLDFVSPPINRIAQSVYPLPVRIIPVNDPISVDIRTTDAEVANLRERNQTTLEVIVEDVDILEENVWCRLSTQRGKLYIQESYKGETISFIFPTKNADDLLEFEGKIGVVKHALKSISYKVGSNYSGYGINGPERFDVSCSDQGAFGIKFNGTKFFNFSRREIPEVFNNYTENITTDSDYLEWDIEPVNEDPRFFWIDLYRVVPVDDWDTFPIEFHFALIDDSSEVNVIIEALSTDLDMTFFSTAIGEEDPWEPWDDEMFEVTKYDDDGDIWKINVNTDGNYNVESDLWLKFEYSGDDGDDDYEVCRQVVNITIIDDEGLSSVKETIRIFRESTTDNTCGAQLEGVDGILICNDTVNGRVERVTQILGVGIIPDPPPGRPGPPPSIDDMLLDDFTVSVLRGRISLGDSLVWEESISMSDVTVVEFNALFSPPGDPSSGKFFFQNNGTFDCSMDDEITIEITYTIEVDGEEGPELEINIEQKIFIFVDKKIIPPSLTYKKWLQTGPTFDDLISGTEDTNIDLSGIQIHPMDPETMEHRASLEITIERNTSGILTSFSEYNRSGQVTFEAYYTGRDTIYTVTGTRREINLFLRDLTLIPTLNFNGELRFNFKRTMIAMNISFTDLVDDYNNKLDIDALIYVRPVPDPPLIYFDSSFVFLRESSAPYDEFNIRIRDPDNNENWELEVELSCMKGRLSFSVPFPSDKLLLKSNTTTTQRFSGNITYVNEYIQHLRYHIVHMGFDYVKITGITGEDGAKPNEGFRYINIWIEPDITLVEFGVDNLVEERSYDQETYPFPITITKQNPDQEQFDMFVFSGIPNKLSTNGFRRDRYECHSTWVFFEGPNGTFSDMNIIVPPLYYTTDVPEVPAVACPDVPFTVEVTSYSVEPINGKYEYSETKEIDVTISNNPLPPKIVKGNFARNAREDKAIIISNGLRIVDFPGSENVYCKFTVQYNANDANDANKYDLIIGGSEREQGTRGEVTIPNISINAMNTELENITVTMENHYFGPANISIECCPNDDCKDPYKSISIIQLYFLPVHTAPKIEVLSSGLPGRPPFEIEQFTEKTTIRIKVTDYDDNENITVNMAYTGGRINLPNASRYGFIPDESVINRVNKTLLDGTLNNGTHTVLLLKGSLSADTNMSNVITFMAHHSVVNELVGYIELYPRPEERGDTYFTFIIEDNFEAVKKNKTIKIFPVNSKPKVVVKAFENITGIEDTILHLRTELRIYDDERTDVDVLGTMTISCDDGKISLTTLEDVSILDNSEHSLIIEGTRENLEFVCQNLVFQPNPNWFGMAAVLFEYDDKEPDMLENVEGSPGGNLVGNDTMYVIYNNTFDEPEIVQLMKFIVVSPDGEFPPRFLEITDIDRGAYNFSMSISVVEGGGGALVYDGSTQETHTIVNMRLGDLDSILRNEVSYDGDGDTDVLTVSFESYYGDFDPSEFEFVIINEQFDIATQTYVEDVLIYENNTLQNWVTGEPQLINYDDILSGVISKDGEIKYALPGDSSLTTEVYTKKQDLEDFLDGSDLNYTADDGPGTFYAIVIVRDLDDGNEQVFVFYIIIEVTFIVITPSSLRATPREVNLDENEQEQFSVSATWHDEGTHLIVLDNVMYLFAVVSVDRHYFCLNETHGCSFEFEYRDESTHVPITIKPRRWYKGEFDLRVIARTWNEDSGDTAEIATTVHFDVHPILHALDVTVMDLDVSETQKRFEVYIRVMQEDPTEILTVIVECEFGHIDGANATSDPNQWVVIPEVLNDFDNGVWFVLTKRPVDSQRFTVKVIANSTEVLNGGSTIVEKTFTVIRKHVFAQIAYFGDDVFNGTEDQLVNVFLSFRLDNIDDYFFARLFFYETGYAREVAHSITVVESSIFPTITKDVFDRSYKFSFEIPDDILDISDDYLFINGTFAVALQPNYAGKVEVEIEMNTQETSLGLSAIRKDSFVMYIESSYDNTYIVGPDFVDSVGNIETPFHYDIINPDEFEGKVECDYTVRIWTDGPLEFLRGYADSGDPDINFPFASFSDVEQFFNTLYFKCIGTDYLFNNITLSVDDHGCDPVPSQEISTITYFNVTTFCEPVNHPGEILFLDLHDDTELEKQIYHLSSGEFVDVRVQIYDIDKIENEYELHFVCVQAAFEFNDTHAAKHHFTLTGTRDVINTILNVTKIGYIDLPAHTLFDYWYQDIVGVDLHVQRELEVPAYDVAGFYRKAMKETYRIGPLSGFMGAIGCNENHGGERCQLRQNINGLLGLYHSIGKLVASSGTGRDGSIVRRENGEEEVTIRDVCMTENNVWVIDSEYDVFVKGVNYQNGYLGAHDLSGVTDEFVKLDRSEDVYEDDWAPTGISMMNSFKKGANKWFVTKNVLVNNSTNVTKEVVYESYPIKLACTRSSVFVLTQDHKLFVMGMNADHEVDGNRALTTFHETKNEVLDVETSYHTAYVLHDETTTMSVLDDVSVLRMYAIGRNHKGCIGSAGYSLAHSYGRYVQLTYDFVSDYSDPSLFQQIWSMDFPFSWLGDQFFSPISPRLKAMQYGLWLTYELSSGKMEHFYVGMDHPSRGTDVDKLTLVDFATDANLYPGTFYSSISEYDHINYVDRIVDDTPDGGCMYLVTEHFPEVKIHVSGNPKCSTNNGIKPNALYPFPQELQDVNYGDFVNNREQIFLFTCGVTCFILTGRMDPKMYVFGSTRNLPQSLVGDVDCVDDHCRTITYASSTFQYVVPQKQKEIDTQSRIFLVQKGSIFNSMRDRDTYFFPPSIVFSESGMHNNNLTIKIKKPEVFMQKDAQIYWMGRNEFTGKWERKDVDETLHYPYLTPEKRSSWSMWNVEEGEHNGGPSDYYTINLPWSDFRTLGKFEYFPAGSDRDKSGKLLNFDLYQTRLVFVERFFLGWRYGKHLQDREEFFFDVEIRFPKVVLRSDIWVQQDSFTDYWDVYVVDKTFDRQTRTGTVKIASVTRSPNFWVFPDRAIAALPDYHHFGSSTSRYTHTQRLEAPYPNEDPKYVKQTYMLIEISGSTTPFHTPENGTYNCDHERCYQQWMLSFQLTDDTRVCNVPVITFPMNFVQFCSIKEMSNKYHRDGQKEIDHPDCVNPSQEITVFLAVGMDDLCSGEMIETVDTDFEMLVYTDWKYENLVSTDTHIFQVGDWIYLLTRVHSEEVTIINTDVETIVVVDDSGVSTVLYEEVLSDGQFVATTMGMVCGIIIDDIETPTEVGFHFKLHNDLLRLGANVKKKFTIEAYLRVLYEGNDFEVVPIHASEMKKRRRSGGILKGLGVTGKLDITVQDAKLGKNFSALPYFAVILGIICCVVAVGALIAVCGITVGKESSRIIQKKVADVKALDDNSDELDSIDSEESDGRREVIVVVANPVNEKQESSGESASEYEWETDTTDDSSGTYSSETGDESYLEEESS